MAGTVSRTLALRHEALIGRLDALLKELAPMARKRPEARVPAAVQKSAEQILFEARPFGVAAPLPEKTGVVPAPETWAGLIAGLAEARATIETFETTHSAWDAALQCRAWQIAAGAPLPIGRLRTLPRPGTAAARRDTEADRRKLTARLDELITAAYEQGFADATEGRPSTPYPTTLAAREEQLNNG
jgi:hypothetical protein